MEIKELEKKYNIVYINGNRFYINDLSERTYNYEYAIPCYFSYKNIEIFNNSWKNMLVEIINKLDEINPKSEEELLSIKCDWGKQSVFSKEKKQNFVPFKNIFINCNHTAIHAMWTIQLILQFYNIQTDECIFLIKRPPICEYDEIRNYFKNETINNFKEYLSSNKNLKEESINTVLKCIEYINKHLLSIVNKSYNDLFLTEDQKTLLVLKSKIFNKIDDNPKMNDRKKKILKQSLYLFSCFNKLESEKRKKERPSYFRKKGKTFEDEIMKFVIIDNFNK